MTSVATSGDVLAVETIDDLHAAFKLDVWTNTFMVHVTTADADGKHAKVDASYEVALVPFVHVDDVSGVPFFLRGMYYTVRRATIKGHAADFYLDEFGHGHIGLAENGQMILLHDRGYGETLHRLERVAIHRVLSISPVHAGL